MKYRKNKVISLLSAMALLGSALSGCTALGEDAGQKAGTEHEI